MRAKTIGVALGGLMAGTLLAACSSSPAASPPTSGGASAAASGAATEAGSEAPTEITNLILGAVPSLDLGLLEVAKQQGYLDEAGISVEVVPVDSGPNVVTGVVAGQYDIGSTAYAPPLLALAEGAPLELVSSSGTVGPDGTNGGTLVKKDSGITSWKDLAGKTIASNAPRSLFSLTIPAAIANDGGDPSGIEIVPLPFNQIPKAVADGQVDAGVALEPFLTGGLAEFSDLANLGDSVHAVLPEGSGSGLYFTSTSTGQAKRAAIDAFAAALAKTYAYANDHLDEVKAAGAPLAGLTAEQALGLPLSKYNASINETDLQALVDLMIKYNWITTAPDLATFVK